VVSYANAWGLMQLLPTVGKAMAREEGIRNFQTFNCSIRRPISGWGHVICDRCWSALGSAGVRAAAYNAGDSRVADWEAAGPTRA